MDSRRFTVALSFPGEYRNFVSQVAQELANTLSEERVLYDKFHEEELARLDLHIYLPALYRKDSELIVIFLCAEYARKVWCKLEWRHISQLIATAEAKRVMLLSFGNPGDLSEIGILGGDGWIDVLPLTPETVAKKILKRLQINRDSEPPPPPPPVTTRTAPVPADISRVVEYAPDKLVGRESETTLLADSWDLVIRGEKNRPHVLTFVALGGEGKTSLVAKWAAELAYQDWAGCDAAFAWSFYSQGTGEKTQASSDTFLAEALRFFGDEEMAASAKSGYEKGKRLARLVGEKRALLILDGVEPLQYAPGPPMEGKLKDDGVAALLKALAATNRGLCIVTTRYSIPDLKAFWQTTAPEIKLRSLSRDAGVHLLKTLGVKGTQPEFEKLVVDVKGHALTLNLLGTYLRDAHGGDIRKRDLVKLEVADGEEQSGHAFHVMDAYVASFKAEGENGKRALSILRMLGLFDRPAVTELLHALWTGDEIGGLTGPLIGLAEAERNITLARLQDANLITVNREEGSGRLLSVDAHPLVREYFASRVRKQFPGAWRAAHRRLYEYLRDNTQEGDEPTLEDLQPLYQAVAHGCQAGLHNDALAGVFRDRLDRDREAYAITRLGAYGSHLSALVSFFDEPWSRPVSALNGISRAFVLQGAGYSLNALGRLNEARGPIRAATDYVALDEDWENAARGAEALIELELTLGEISTALIDAEVAITYANRSTKPFHQMVKRALYAHVLHQAGLRRDAEVGFTEAERTQKASQPDYPSLYSMSAYYYGELMLDDLVRATWLKLLRLNDGKLELETIRTKRNDVTTRAQLMLDATKVRGRLLDRALAHLLLGRVELHSAILEQSGISATANIDFAAVGLRSANRHDYLPLGLMLRSVLLFLSEARTGPESAQEDLDEAWEIAERGPMRLHMADIHLHRARLFHAVKPYPWDKFADGSEGRGAKDDLADARKLIEQCGYWRRKEELEDAEEAAKAW